LRRSKARDSRMKSMDSTFEAAAPPSSFSSSLIHRSKSPTHPKSRIYARLRLLTG